LTAAAEPILQQRRVVGLIHLEVQRPLKGFSAVATGGVRPGPGSSNAARSPLRSMHPLSRPPSNGSAGESMPPTSGRCRWRWPSKPIADST
jgi:hypothetical protein